MMENQYLKPEELPITDAKKSPLALLAMTCSNIGADILGTGKPMLGFDKNRKIRSDDSRSESVTSDKIHANSMDSNRSGSRESSDGFVSKNHSSSGHKISFKPYEDLPNNNNKRQDNRSQDESRRVSTSSPKRKERSPSPASSAFRKTRNQSKSPETTTRDKQSATNGTHSSSSSSFAQQSSESDKLKNLGLLSSSLNHHHLSKTGLCRDPFCPGCQLSHMHNFLPSPSTPVSSSSSSSCCSSFPHCVHAQAASHFASFPHPSLAYASNLARYGSNGVTTSTRPFLCHWTAGGSYCGKSFASCEELLQHLKTHTLSSSAVNSSSSSTSFPGLGSFMNPHSSLLPGLGSRHTSSLDSLRYHPYKLNGHPSLGSQHLRSPTSMTHSASSNLFSHHHQQHLSSLASPSMTVFHPTQHPSLGSYYTLLN